MQFKEFYRKIFTKQRHIARIYKEVLKKFKEQCENDEDNIQYYQLKIMLETHDFISDFFNISIGDEIRVAKQLNVITEIYESNNISCWEYAYYINVVLKCFGANMDEVFWVDPRMDDYKDVGYSGNTKSFGFGVYKKDINDFCIDKGVLTKYVGTSLSVIVPFGVKKIADQVFAGNNNLRYVFLPKGLISFGKDVFKDCKNLIYIEMSGCESTKISEGCFSGCENLADVHFPKVEIIESSAFAGTNVQMDPYTFPKVKEVKPFSFANNSAIKNINQIYKTKINVHPNAFADCKIESFQYGIAKPLCEVLSTDAESFNKYFAHLTSVDYYGENLVVNSFAGLTNIKNVSAICNDGIIPNGAFLQCTSLETVNVKNEITHIGYSAFESCGSLKNINGKFNITALPEKAFYRCNNLSLPFDVSKITSVGSRALVATNIQGIRRFEGFTDIGEFAFASAKFADNLVINLENTNNVGQGCFFQAYSISELVLNDSHFNGKMHIAQFFEKEITVFSQAYIIENLKITNGLGDLILQNLSNIKHICLENANISVIPNNFCKECINLESFSIDCEIEAVGESCFEHCKNLKVLKGFDKCVNIGNSAFKKCRSLDVTSLVKNAESIGSYAFVDCSLNKEVVLSNNLKSIGVGSLANKSVIERLELSIVSGATLSEIFTFEGETNNALSFHEIILHNTLSKEEFTDFFNAVVNVKTVEIKQSDYIDQSMCDCFNEVQTIYLGEGVKSVDCTIFSNQYKIVIDKNNPYINFDENGVYSADSKELFAMFKDTKNDIFDKIETISDSAIFDKTIDLDYLFPSLTKIKTAGLLNCQIDILKFNNKIQFESGALCDCNISKLVVESMDCVSMGAIAFRSENYTLSNLEILNLASDQSVYKLFYNIDKNHYCLPPNVGHISIQDSNLSDLNNKIRSTVTTLDIKQSYLASENIFEDLKIENLILNDGIDYHQGCLQGGKIKNLHMQSVEGSIEKLIGEQNDQIVIYNSITIDKGEIPTGCFQGLKNPINVELGNGVTAISNQAFCNAFLNEVKLQSNFLKIDENAFFGASIKSLIISPDCKNCRAVDDLLLWNNTVIYLVNKDKTHLQIDENINSLPVWITDLMCNIEEVNIVNLKAKLANQQFAKMSKLVKISLGDVKYIECLNDLVGYENNIREVVYSEDYIKEGYFQQMPNLQNFYTIKKVNNIGANAFFGDCNLENIKFAEDATTIGDLAFACCEKITTAKISSEISSVGVGVFHGCEHLEELSMPIVRTQLKCGESLPFGAMFAVVEVANSIAISQKSAGQPILYYIPKSLNNVVITGGELSKGYFENIPCKISILCSTSEVPDYCFANVKSVDINFQEIKLIGNHAFENYSHDNLDLPQCESVGEKSFAGVCVDNVYINNCKSIGREAFAGSKINGKIVIQECFEEFDYSIFHNSVIGEVQLINPIKYAVWNNCVIKCGVLEKFIPSSIIKEIDVDCVEVINDNVFTDNRTIEKVRFANAKVIKEYAFKQTCIADYHLPSVEIIGNGAFLSSNIEYLQAENLKEIGAYAFWHCSMLKDFSCGRDLTSIGDEAFSDCECIEQLDFSGCEELAQIGNMAFSKCNILKTLLLPNNIQRIGWQLIGISNNIERLQIPFIGEHSGYNDVIEYLNNGDMSLLKELKVDKMSEIKSNTLKRASNLNTLTINGDVQSIESSAFKGMSELLEVNLNYIGEHLADYLFEDCRNIVKVFSLKNVSAIGCCAFNNCINLLNLEGLENIEKICSYAFNDCRVIENMQFSSLMAVVEKNVFKGCLALKSIGEAKLKNVGEYAFCECQQLTYVDLSVCGIINIGAFKNCYNLETVDSCMISNICDEAFNNCGKLKYIDLSKCEAVGKSAFSGCCVLNGIDISEVKSLSPFSFMNCNSIAKITFGDNLLNIPEYCFINCTKLKYVTFGENVSQIESHAFDGCMLGEKLQLSNNIKTVGSEAFSNTSIQSLHIPNLQVNFENNSFGKANARITDITVESIDQITVESFKKFKKISRVVCLSNINAIQAEAFNEYAHLTCFSAEHIDVIGRSAFSNCKKLDSFDVKEVNRLNDYAFAYCEKLKLFNFSNCSYVGENAFRCCYSLYRVKIHKAEEICYNAFYYCSNMREIYLGKDVKKVHDKCFEKCSSLQDVGIHGDIEHVGKAIFSHCPKQLVIKVVKGKSSHFYSSNWDKNWNLRSQVLLVKSKLKYEMVSKPLLLE